MSPSRAPVEPEVLTSVMLWYNTHPDENEQRAIGQHLEHAAIPGLDVEAVLEGTERIPDGGMNMQQAYAWPNVELWPDARWNGRKPRQEVLRGMHQRSQAVVERNKNYGVILDLHNPAEGCSTLDYVSMSMEQSCRADTRLLGFLRHVLGIKRFVIMDDVGMLPYSPNCVAVEIDHGSKRAEPEYWETKLPILTTGEVPSATLDDFECYVLVSATLDAGRAAELGLPDNIPAFGELPEHIAAQVISNRGKSKIVVRAIAVKDPKGRGSWGELAMRIPAPSAIA